VFGRHKLTVGGCLSSLLLLGTVMVISVPAAWGAVPPSNDDHANALVVQPPQSVRGTLVGATLEVANDVSACVSTNASVWYQFTAPPRGAVVVQLDAAGRMDGSVDLFRQVRSRLDPVDCSPTDAQGNATLDVEGLQPGASYAIRVGNQPGSVADEFVLRVLVPTAPPEPPGRHLPYVGVRNSVDRLLNSGDVYWTRMRAGRTMRLSLRTSQCTSLAVYGPGTRSFSDPPLRRFPCGGYGLFTATRSGQHFLVVTAGRSREPQPYKLRVARALLDDTAPGVLMHNHSEVTGTVNGGIDTRDLYRFDVTRRSALTLRLAGEPTLKLLRENGRGVGGGLIDRTIAAGRYFVAVEGSGRYTLRLDLRTITVAAMSFNGRHAASIRPGSSARLRLSVRPAVSGPSETSVERFDPVDGWQFVRAYRLRVSHGRSAVTFAPPSVGRYRARGMFLGSRSAAPAATRFAYLRVAGPLADRRTHTPQPPR
jgi:hypothetical protein